MLKIAEKSKVPFSQAAHQNFETANEQLQARNN